MIRSMTTARPSPRTLAPIITIPTTIPELAVCSPPLLIPCLLLILTFSQAAEVLTDVLGTHDDPDNRALDRAGDDSSLLTFIYDF